MTRKIGCGALLLSQAQQSIPRLPPELVRQLPPADPGRILLFQRGYGAPTFPGCWGGPGGIFKKKTDMSLAAAAQREVFEETGITFWPEPTPFYSGQMPNRYLGYFLGNWQLPESGMVVFPDHETIGSGWFTAAEALRLSLSFKYREAIKQLKVASLL